MNKIYTGILILITALFPGNFTKQHSAVALKVKGEVYIYPGGSSSGKQLKKDMKIYSGDRITTGNGGFAAIKFIDDASLLRIRSNSDCTVRTQWKEERQEKNIWLELGALWASITRQKTVFSVRTPTAVASVKGTKFWAMQFRDGSARFVGEEGVVEVANQFGAVLMRKNQTVEIKEKTLRPVLRATREGDIDPKWKDEDEKKKFIDEDGDGIDDRNRKRSDSPDQRLPRPTDRIQDRTLSPGDVPSIRKLPLR